MADTVLVIRGSAEMVELTEELVRGVATDRGLTVTRVFEGEKDVARLLARALFWMPAVGSPADDANYIEQDLGEDIAAFRKAVAALEGGETDDQDS